MADSTYKIYLMIKEAGNYHKLVDIKDFPDLGGTPELIETTTLSHSSDTYINGAQTFDSLSFTANYNLADYGMLRSLEGTQKEYAVYFGGEESGAFLFKGALSVYAEGGGTDEVVEMSITIAPSTAIQFEEYFAPDDKRAFTWNFGSKEVL